MIEDQARRTTVNVIEETHSPVIVGDPRENMQSLLRDLRARPGGLSAEEAARRRVQY